MWGPPFVGGPRPGPTGPRPKNGTGQTDRQTDIATYRAAIAAKKNNLFYHSQNHE